MLKHFKLMKEEAACHKRPNYALCCPHVLPTSYMSLPPEGTDSVQLKIKTA